MAAYTQFGYGYPSASQVCTILFFAKLFVVYFIHFFFVWFAYNILVSCTRIVFFGVARVMHIHQSTTPIEMQWNLVHDFGMIHLRFLLLLLFFARELQREREHVDALSDSLNLPLHSNKFNVDKRNVSKIVLWCATEKSVSEYENREKKSNHQQISFLSYSFRAIFSRSVCTVWGRI